MIVPLFALANAGIHVTGGLLGDAVHSPITLGILVGYVVGKPLGILGGSWLASRPTLRGPALAAQRAVARRRRRSRRDRVHGLAADLRASRSAAAALDEAKLGVLASVVIAPLVAWCIIARSCAGCRPRVRARQIGAHRRGHPRPRRGRRPRSRSHPRPGRRAGHARRVRRLRVPVLRPGRAGDPRSCSASLGGRRALRLAPSAAERRAPERAARGRGGGGGGAPRGGSGRCTTPCSATRTRSSRATSIAHARAPRARRRALHGRPAPPRARGRASREDVASADESGVSGTPTLLHQRPAPLRRLRHRHADRRRQGREEPGTGDSGGLTTAPRAAGPTAAPGSSRRRPHPRRRSARRRAPCAPSGTGRRGARAARPLGCA